MMAMGHKLSEAYKYSLKTIFPKETKHVENSGTLETAMRKGSFEVNMRICYQNRIRPSVADAGNGGSYTFRQRFS